MAKAFTHFAQLDQMDCGPTCLRMVARHYGRHYTVQTLNEKAQISRDGVSMLGISEAAEAIGFRTIGIKVTFDKLIKEAPLPCILHWRQNHFVVLYRVEENRIGLGAQVLERVWGGKKPSAYPEEVSNDNTSGKSENFLSGNHFSANRHVLHIADPAKGLLTYTAKEFQKHWLSSQDAGRREGLALLLEPTSKFYEEEGEKVNAVELQQLFGYLWRYKRLLIQLILGMLVGSGLSLLVPFLTQSIVDNGIATQNLGFIYLILIAQLVLMLSATAVDFIRSWILLHISIRINLTILSEFLSKMMRLPVSFFDVKHFGDLMQRIGDHHRIETFLTGQTLIVLFSILNMFVYGFLLAFYDQIIFLLAAGASTLYALWIILFLRRRKKLDAARFDISSRSQGQVVQLIQGMQDIKLSGAETAKRWDWEQTQAKLFKWNVKNLSLTQYQQAGGILINQSKNIVIIFLAAKAVVEGQLTLGEMMSIQFILAQFNAPIEQMVVFLQSWQDAQMSLERLNEVHGLADEEPSDVPKRIQWDPDQDICLKNVSYTYPGAGNQPALKNINILVKHGLTTAIVGTSGSGKTTLLKLLLRFYEPQEGSITLKHRQRTDAFVTQGNEPQQSFFSGAETDIKNISQRAWRMQCGVVMQEGFIFSDSIAQNIAVGEDIIDYARLQQAARMANIHQYIESLPLGFQTKIGAEGNGISQGQKQRILIARSVYKNPRVLLFDEATNALDASNEAIIIKNLENFFHGRTVIVVAHRLSTVRHADQIVVMERGEIVEVGKHTELVKAKGKYYELVSNQLELAHE